MNQLQLTFTEEEKRRTKGHTETILSMLEDGPVSSIVLKDVTHRFSAPINILRERGYQIDVEKLSDGTSIHTLIGYTPLVEVTDEMKAAYYETEHWQIRRRERLAMDEFTCRSCMSTDSLQVHHWVYELFAESINDLMTLCNGCHERFHAYDSVKIHFPRYVSQEIADRLKGKVPA